MADLDLNAIMHDDWLIDAIASGTVLETDHTDPARAPLRALAEMVDTPIPEYDDAFDPLALVDTGRQRRHAVRSLAIAVTAVATLSTSGVSAVVSGDPLLPAKAVWHQIEGSTGEARAPAVPDGERSVGSASATEPSSPTLAPEAAQDPGQELRRAAVDAVGTRMGGDAAPALGDRSQQADGQGAGGPGDSAADTPEADVPGSGSADGGSGDGEPKGRGQESETTPESQSSVDSSGRQSSDSSEPIRTAPDPARANGKWESPAPSQDEQPPVITDEPAAPEGAWQAVPSLSGTEAASSADAQDDSASNPDQQ